MQKVYSSRQQMLKDLAEHSDIDYEKTFNARELAFVTKDGKEFWAPVWHLYIQSLVENANAKINPEGCHKYPRSYIILFEEQEDSEEKDENVAEGVLESEVVGKETKEEQEEKPKAQRGRKSNK